MSRPRGEPNCVEGDRKGGNIRRKTAEKLIGVRTNEGDRERTKGEE